MKSFNNFTEVTGAQKGVKKNYRSSVETRGGQKSDRRRTKTRKCDETQWRGKRVERRRQETREQSGEGGR